MTEPVGTPSLAKWIRLMADHSSTGMWLSDGTMADPEEVPVSSHLHARIETWCGWYETSQSNLFPHERTTVFDCKSFSMEGLAIARAIKTELPDWKVVYFDEAACEERRDCANRTRDVFEYEII